MEEQDHSTQTVAGRSTFEEYSLSSIHPPHFPKQYYREMRALIEEVYWQKKRNQEGQQRREREDLDQENNN
jgi:hypothetical protein